MTGRHRTPHTVGPPEVADAERLWRWQREQDLLEQQQADLRAALRGRIVWVVILALIALDVLVALGVILVFTA